MSEQSFDFCIIYVKMTNPEEQMESENNQLSQVEINEFNEIRKLREMVLEVQARPQVLFTTT